MQLSSAHKQRLGKVARVATAGAIMAASLGSAVAPVAHGILTSNKVTVGDSRPGNAATTYTIRFRPAASTLTAINQINIDFCTAAGAYSDPCTPPTGMLTDTAVTASGFGAGGATTGTPTAPAANRIVFVVTTPASEVASTDHDIVATNITNPTGAGTYYARIRTFSDTGTVPIDNGTSAFAVVDYVQISGTVLESMTFSVAGVAASTACGTGNTTSSGVTSTNVAIPFGNFVSGTPRVSCQTISTATNASQGYITFVKQVLGGAGAGVGALCRQTASLCTANGGQSSIASTDYVADTTMTSTPGAWSNGVWFGQGVGANGSQANSQFTNATHYRTMSGTAGVQIANSATSTVATNTSVAYKADVPSNQTAGVYMNALEYITTPTF